MSKHSFSYVVGFSFDKIGDINIIIQTFPIVTPHYKKKTIFNFTLFAFP